MRISLFLIVSFLLLACQARVLHADLEGKEENMSVRYFSGISGITLPYVPRDEVTAEQAHSLPAYLRVRFDEDGRVTKLEKVIGDKLDFDHEYEYYDDGSLRRATVNVPGNELVVHEFPRGKQRH